MKGREKKFCERIEKEKESSKKVEEIEVAKASVEEKLVVKEEKKEDSKENKPSKEEDSKENKPSKQEDEEKDKKAEEGQKEKNNVATDQERKVDIIDEDIAVWGVPLLPSKGDSATDVILLKFLRARDFEVNDAFEMLRNTLQWRKDNKVDSILDEDFGDDLGSIENMDGTSREGHPVCYSNFKLLGNEEVYNKMLGNEESRECL
ncbi:patellin-4 [Prunus yedoensis var. nudiflora]|uniref:Patellin-4 n=1 Tax=Prunus yedoensis var. nudiflora TaxID=2094558 RepID=A0A314ZPU5_PRUYE|nr:patellin-4 [Prunus yedoensis var. nudiflora]